MKKEYLPQNKTIMKRILFILALVMGAISVMAEESITTSTAEEPILIKRIGNTYYYNYVAMDKKACDEFLAEKQLPIYHEFHSGYTLQRKGWILLGTGLGLDFLGSTLMVLSLLTMNDASSIAMLAVGAVSFTVGVGCEVASIPVLSIGYTRMHDCVDHYYRQQKNKQCSLSLNLTASQNGLGLALKF